MKKLYNYEYNFSYFENLTDVYINNHNIDNQYNNRNISSLTLSALNIREFFNTSSQYKIETSNSVINDTIKPMNNLISQQLDLGSKLKDEFRRLEKDYKESINNLEKQKNKFLNHYIQVENNTRDYELSKLNPMNQINTDKLAVKVNNILKEAKEIEKAYLIQLSQANNLRGQFIEEVKRILAIFENLDVELSNIFKSSFQKYVVYYSANLTNISFDFDKIKKSVSSINTDKDKINFIQKNKKPYEYPIKHDYNGYHIKLQENMNTESQYPPEIVIKIVDTIQSNFLMKTSEWDCECEINKLHVCKIVRNIFEKDSITNEDRITTCKLLNDNRLRLFFLKQLNNYRIKGVFNIKENNFDVIGEILKKIINSCVISSKKSSSYRKKSDDNTFDNIEEVLSNADKEYYENCKFVIILSQTFKCDGVLLQEKIENEPIFKTREFWVNMIQSKLN